MHDRGERSAHSNLGGPVRPADGPSGTRTYRDAAPPAVSSSPELSTRDARSLIPDLKPWVWDWFFPHQRMGATLSIMRRDNHLWWAPAAGKTAAALAWLLAEPGLGLVVTNASLRTQWAGEVRRLTEVEPFVLMPVSERKPNDETLEHYLDRTPRPIIIIGRNSLFEDDEHEKILRLAGYPGGLAIAWDEIHRMRSPRRWVRHEDSIVAWVDAYGEPTEAPERDTRGFPGANARGIMAYPRLREIPDDCFRPRDDHSIWLEPRQSIAARAGRLAPRAQRRIAATGTPLADRVRNLWAQLDMVQPKKWGPFHPWSKRYCAGYEGPYGWIDTGHSNLDELWQRMDPVVHRVPAEEVRKHLPEARRVMTRLEPSTLGRSDREANAAVRKAAKAAGGGAGTIGGDLQRELLRALLEQAAARKSPYVADTVVDCLCGGQKVLVFTARRVDVETIHGKVIRAMKRRGDAPDGVLDRIWAAHGGNTVRQRDRIKDAYMGTSAPCGIVGTGDCWGEGHDLQDTDRLIVVLLPWSWEQLFQWEGRVSRPGQQRPVFIEYLIAVGTRDERVAQVVLDKLDPVGRLVPDKQVGAVKETIMGGTTDKVIDGLLDRFME